MPKDSVALIEGRARTSETVKRSAISAGGTIPGARTPEAGSATSGATRCHTVSPGTSLAPARSRTASGRRLRTLAKAREEDGQALLFGETAEEEDHGPAPNAVARPDLGRAPAGPRRIGHRGQDPADLLDPVGERRRVPRIVLGVGDDAVGALEGEVLRGAGEHVDESLSAGGRQLEVAVIRDDDRHAQRCGQKRDRDGVGRGRVQVQDVRARKLGQGPRHDRRGDEGLADARQDRGADDADAVLFAFERELGSMAVGQHAHRVAPRRERFGEVLDVERQPRHVRPVVVDRHEDPHSGRVDGVDGGVSRQDRPEERKRPDGVGLGIRLPLHVSDDDVRDSVLVDRLPGEPGIRGRCRSGGSGRGAPAPARRRCAREARGWPIRARSGRRCGTRSARTPCTGRPRLPGSSSRWARSSGATRRRRRRRGSASRAAPRGRARSVRPSAGSARSRRSAARGPRARRAPRAPPARAVGAARAPRSRRGPRRRSRRSRAAARPGGST